MFRKLYIFIFLMLVFEFRLSAACENDFFYIEDVIYNEGIRFPYVVSKVSAKEKVAQYINMKLQSILFHDGEIINKDNVEAIHEDIYEIEDGVPRAGIVSLDYTCEIFHRFLKVSIDIDWAGGPYPVGAATDYLQFDLEKGELILLPDLIEGSKYFDFLEKYWLGDCRNSIKEMHQCAYGNETGDYESEKAYKLDGQCEFRCHIMNHGFILGKDSIFVSNNSDCFPHAWQNCNSGASKYLRIGEIKEYLSDYGKWLLGFTNSYIEVKPYYHFVGKLDNKYKVSMSLYESKDHGISGEYFYWTQNKKIPLRGQISIEEKKISLNEFVDNVQTGSFKLDWDHFLYSTDGFWYNDKAKEKKLSVDLTNIYDYRDREYYR
jgi:hypothetical protein